MKVEGTVSQQGNSTVGQRPRHRGAYSRLLAILIPLVLMLSFAAASAPQASALPENFFGFQFGTGWFPNEQYPSSEPDMEAVSRSGAKYWRLPFDCHNKDWTKYDKEVRLAWEHGISIIANPSARCGDGSGQVPVSAEWEPKGSLWETWLYELVGHYGWNGSFWSGKSNIKPITVWEVWNEPNLGSSGSSGVSGIANGNYYGKFLKRSANALNEAQNAQATCCGISVLMGGLLTVAEKEGNKTVHNFIKEANEVSGLASSISGVAVHPYAYDPEADTKVENNITTDREDINQLGSGKSMWITEIGWPVEHGGGVFTQVTEPRQSELLTNVFNWVKGQQASKNIQSLIFYNYRDFTLNESWITGCGLRKRPPSEQFSQTTFRSAWYAFQSQTGAAKWPVQPTAETQAATSIKATEATLNGTINPHGLPTGYRFEYGPSTTYTNSSPSSYQEGGWEDKNISISNTLTGLHPNTVYHFRIVASNENNESVQAQDRTFRTPSLITGHKFSTPTSWAAWPTDSAEVDFADTNGDGKADAIGKNSAGEVRVSWSTGSSFGGASFWATWPAGYSIDFADTNGDGKADAIGKNAAGDLFVSWSNGVNGFPGGSSWGTWPSGYSLEFADVNGDGRADAVGMNSAGDVKVGLSTTSNTFATPTTWATWPAGYSIDFADTNGDGKADAVGKNAAGDVKVAWSNGVNGFPGGTSWATWPAGYSIDFADTNGDGKADAIGKNAAGDLFVAWSNGVSGFPGGSSWGTWPSGYSLEFKDVNGDKRADAVGTNSTGDVKVSLSTTSNKFATPASWASWPVGSSSIDFADTNFDGKADAIGKNSAGDLRVSWSTGSSFGGGSLWATWLAGYSIDFADTNGDGKADAIGENSAGNVFVSWSSGIGFPGGSSWATWPSGYSLEFADTNGDGKTDAIGKNSAGDVKVAWSNGVNGFPGGTSWATWPAGYSIDFADTNGDGKADAIGMNSAGDVKVAWSNGSSAFLTPSTWATWPSGYSIDFADVNGDGMADAVGKNAAGDVKVGLSTGAKFNTPTSWATWPAGYSLEFADVNADGVADAVGMNSASDVKVGLASE